MFAFLRPSLPVRSNNAANNPVTYADGRSQLHFNPPGSQYLMVHTVAPTTSQLGVSVIKPPFHYHIYQTEHFRVRSGTGRFYRGLDKEPVAILSSEPGRERTLTIPARRYHRYENVSQTEDLVVDIQLEPEDYENEQRFFRNFFGYLDDCKRIKSSPSLFQLMVFLHSADTPLALPCPSEKLGVCVSWLFMVFMAYFGKYMLGYKNSYPEYYDGEKSR